MKQFAIIARLIDFGKSSKTLVCLILWISFASCFQHYYKPNSENQVNREKVEKLISQKKYFIMHTKDSVVALKNLAAETEYLKTEFEILSVEHSKNLNPKVNRGNRMKKKSSAIPLSEVHLYISHSLDSTKALDYIPYSSINRIDIYGFDKDATQSSTIVSIIGIVLGVVLLLVIAMVASGGFYAP